MKSLAIKTPFEYIPERKQYNRHKQEFIDRLPDNVYEIQEYQGYRLDRYYWDIDNKKLIIYTRNRYKIVNPTKNGNLYVVVLNDVDGKNHSCSYKKLYQILSNYTDDYG